jgi:hypothetical protein
MQCPLNQIATDFGCFPNDPIGFIEKFYGIGLGFVAGIALLALIYGGYTVMMSRGDPRRLSDGKIFGFVFIQTVLVDILHVPGFSA